MDDPSFVSFLRACWKAWQTALARVSCKCSLGSIRVSRKLIPDHHYPMNEVCLVLQTWAPLVAPTVMHVEHYYVQLDLPSCQTRKVSIFSQKIPLVCLSGFVSGKQQTRCMRIKTSEAVTPSQWLSNGRWRHQNYNLMKLFLIVVYFCREFKLPTLTVTQRYKVLTK